MSDPRARPGEAPEPEGEAPAPGPERGSEGAGEAGAGEAPPTQRPAIRDMEPFVTIRAHPRRFAWGIPLVFVVSFALGLALVEVNLSLAIAVQLFVQTVGLLWLYVPAARDLRAQERAEWERRRQEAGDAGRAGGDHANGDHARGNQAWGDAGHGAGSARPLPGDAGQTSAETAEADEEPDVTRR